ncbi:hypothetical protein K3495_g8077 [Podosphaera aphanis]|nr:hypothetical protein K3495_g8077 [Podosphaera aphanis]
MEHLIFRGIKLTSQVRRYSMQNFTPFKQPREIVSSYICRARAPGRGLEFAIFKRSQDVLVYRGKWSLCSGSIEATDATPEEAARREIFEETKLSIGDLWLLRKANPFTLRDEDLQTEWKIHPFVWQLKENAKKIVLDSGHTDYRFITLEDLHKFNHVPLLDRSTYEVFSNFNK